jgi:hypothetical protein
VNEWTYANWENGRTTPGAVAYQELAEFLGYYPHPTPRTLGDRLCKIRRCLGLTSRQAGRGGASHLPDVAAGQMDADSPTRTRLERFLERFERDLPRDSSDAVR